ncbi:MAG: hypothetical protein JWN86_2146 [Planctomycetota bacterium]|nr:hypothetical protein [Planctomycetota bacterium]
MIAIILGLLIAAQAPVEIGLSLADLPMYKAALDGRDDSPPVAVQFRDLWGRPAAYRGHRVRVEGRIVRRFQAPASGELPARVELWLATPADDVICAVFPQSVQGGDGFREKSTVAMEGTSLGLVRYQGGDVARLAPLIVGCGEPSPAPVAGPKSSSAGWRETDWMIAAVAAVVVAMLLARAHLRRPVRPRIDLGPPLEFEDQSDEAASRGSTLPDSRE